MARVHLLSDLHTEFGSVDPPPDVRADVAVLAGDTATKGKLHPWPNAASAFGRPMIAIGIHPVTATLLMGGYSIMISSS